MGRSSERNWSMTSQRHHRIRGPRISMPAGGRLVFRVHDGIIGNQLWSTDGTSSSTLRHSNGPGQPWLLIHYTSPSICPVSFFSECQLHWEMSLSIILAGQRPSVNGSRSTTTAVAPMFTWNTVAGRSSYQLWVKNQSTNVNPLLERHDDVTCLYTVSDIGIVVTNAWIRGANSLGRAGSSVGSVQLCH